MIYEDLEKRLLWELLHIFIPAFLMAMVVKSLIASPVIL